MRRSNITLIAILAWVAIFIMNFIKRAYKAGRLLELFISVPILIAAYYLLWIMSTDLVWWALFIPIGVFSAYWFYLFQNEKITNLRVNPNWTNRNWWWSLDGWEFEEEVAKVFRLNGYEAEVTRKTADGGIDLLMYKDNKKIIVQCKHYSSEVGVSVVRELNGIKDDFRANELILVASSGVTKGCKDFIRNKPYFKILDLEDIIRLGLRPYSS